MTDRITGLFPLMLVSFVGVAFSLFVLEIGLRVFDVRPLPVGMGALWQYDDELGWAFMPEMEGWVTKPQDGVSLWVTINSHGWRDTEYAYARPPDTRRILLLGDSFSAAIEVELEETFHAELESLLNANAETPNYEVINTGVGGYSTAQELLVYRKFGRLYEPDIVLLEWFVNDVVENSDLNPSRSAPTFLRDSNAQLALNWGGQNSQGWIEKAKTFLRQRTLIYPTLMSYIHRLSPSSLPQPGGQHTNTNAGADSDPTETNLVLDLFRVPLNEESENAWEITEDLILMMRREVEQDSACFAVVIAPFIFSEEFIAENTAGLGTGRNDRDWDYEGPASRLGAFLELNDISYLDLTPRINQRISLSADPLYLKNDGHWTPLGHAVVADAMHDWIEAMPVAQKCVGDTE